MRVKFRLAKRGRLPFMRIEKEDSIIAVHAMRPLETAVDLATQHLMGWLVDEFSFSQADAYCLVSTCPDFRINVYQMLVATGMDFVAGAEIPRKYLS